MNKCADCVYFSFGGISDQERMQYGYYAPDGICSKYFPRGYIGRKPPHKNTAIQMPVSSLKQKKDPPTDVGGFFNAFNVLDGFFNAFNVLDALDLR